VRNAQAWAIALLIVTLVLMLNIGARLLSARQSRMMR
jgi:ABC-type phosphate transport system permease subunit